MCARKTGGEQRLVRFAVSYGLDARSLLRDSSRVRIDLGYPAGVYLNAAVQRAWTTAGFWLP